MDWLYPKRRGPQWKQGWTSQTVSSISAPSFHLMAIFSIVMILLWLSQYTGYKAQMQQTAVNFQLFMFVLPALLIFFMASYSSSSGLLNFQFWRPRRATPARTSPQAGSSPWGVAIFLVLLLVLLSYQSSFHSKWFSPLRSSD